MSPFDPVSPYAQQDTTPWGHDLPGTAHQKSEILWQKQPPTCLTEVYPRDDPDHDLFATLAILFKALMAAIGVLMAVTFFLICVIALIALIALIASFVSDLAHS